MIWRWSNKKTNKQGNITINTSNDVMYNIAKDIGEIKESSKSTHDRLKKVEKDVKKLKVEVDEIKSNQEAK